MGRFTKNKLLKSYGKGLVENLYSRALLNIEVQKGATFIGSLDHSLAQRIYFLENQQNKRDRKIILESMATVFLEKGLLPYSHFLFTKSNIKKAKLLEKILSNESLEKSRLPEEILEIISKYYSNH